MICDPIKLGIVGLGRGFVLSAPAIMQHVGIRPVAAVALDSASCLAFERDFAGQSYADIDFLLRDEDIEAVYIATPLQLHRQHVIAAANAGKHVLVDKPIAIDMADAAEMVSACHAAGVKLIVGPSHSFDGPVALAEKIIRSGRMGRVKMVHTLNCTDFLYRPRRPEELNTSSGGGIIFSQAIHQIDIVRLLCGGMTKTVSAMSGAWDPARPTEGAYTALLTFDNGAFASLTYSGYGHFDSDIWQQNVDELGRNKDTNSYGSARRLLQTSTTPETETALKQRRTYHAINDMPIAQHHEHFGPTLIFCERGDIRLAPDGVELFEDHQRQFVIAPFSGTRMEVFDALYTAVRHGQEPVQTGVWGLASLEICHAILNSVAGAVVTDLRCQVGVSL